MAEISSIEKLLDCAICLGSCTDPRALPCLHTFCLSCIRGLEHRQQFLNCPMCRQGHYVPDIANLPKNFFFEQIRLAIDSVDSHSLDADTIFSGFVRVVGVLSPTTFFCILPCAPPPQRLPRQLLKVSVSDLGHIDLSRLYVGQYSEAESQNSEVFYRMRVLSLDIQSSSATVLLVDHGMIDRKLLSELFEVQAYDSNLASIMEAPDRAIRCRLKGVAECPSYFGSLASETMRKLALGPESRIFMRTGWHTYADVYAPQPQAGFLYHPVDMYSYNEAGITVQEKMVAAGILKRG